MRGLILRSKGNYNTILWQQVDTVDYHTKNTPADTRRNC